MIQKLNKYLRVVLIILLISIAVVSIYYKYNDCSVCKFDYEEETINAAKFMNLYSERCFVAALDLDWDGDSWVGSNFTK